MIFWLKGSSEPGFSTQGAFVAVYSADGVQVARTAQAASAEHYELPAGLYIVAVYNRKNENYQKLKTKRAFCSLSF